MANGGECMAKVPRMGFETVNECSRGTFPPFNPIPLTPSASHPGSWDARLDACSESGGTQTPSFRWTSGDLNVHRPTPM